jgi:hypothetical protein
MPYKEIIFILGILWNSQKYYVSRMQILFVLKQMVSIVTTMFYGVKLRP